MGNGETNEKIPEADLPNVGSFEAAADMVLKKCAGYPCYQHYSRYVVA